MLTAQMRSGARCVPGLWQALESLGGGPVVVGVKAA